MIKFNKLVAIIILCLVATIITSCGKEWDEALDALETNYNQEIDLIENADDKFEIIKSSDILDLSNKIDSLYNKLDNALSNNKLNDKRLKRFNDIQISVLKKLGVDTTKPKLLTPNELARILEGPFESNRDRIEDIIRLYLSYFSYIDELNENISNANSWGLGSLATLLAPSKKLINEVGSSLINAPDIKDAFRSLYSIDEEGNVSNPSESDSQEQNVAKGIYKHYRNMKVRLDEPDLRSDTKKQRIYEVT